MCRGNSTLHACVHSRNPSMEPKPYHTQAPICNTTPDLSIPLSVSLSLPNPLPSRTVQRRPTPPYQTLIPLSTLPKPPSRASQHRITLPAQRKPKHHPPPETRHTLRPDSTHETYLTSSSSAQINVAILFFFFCGLIIAPHNTSYNSGLVA
jgi:hypothetical protein